MNFSHPLILFFLVIPFLTLIWTWRRQGARVVLPFDYSQKSRGTGWRMAVDSALSIPSFLLAVVIAILAGPQRLTEPKTQRIMTNIEFCVDVPVQCHRDSEKGHDTMLRCRQSTPSSTFARETRLALPSSETRSCTGCR